MSSNQKERGGISLRTVHFLLIIGAVFVSILMFLTSYRLSTEFESMTETSERQIELRKAARELMDASDYLTDRVRCFVVTGDVVYLKDFYEEVDVTRRRDKAGLDHAAHEQVTNPSGILAVGLVPLLRLGVLRMGERDRMVDFESVEHWNPILAGRFHANFVAGIQGQPVVQIPEPLWEARKTLLLVFRPTVCIRDADASIDPCFVDIQSTAVFAMDFEHDVPPTNRFAELAGTGRPAKSSQLRKR